MSAAGSPAGAGFETHPLLTGLGVAHGFGLRGSPPVPGLRRPRQVHGTRVARAGAEAAPLGEADAVVSAAPGVAVGIVTADCLPLLLAADAGRAVAAVHAGWRGLADGVIAAGLEALRAEAGGAARVLAVVGPHIGACCYEVDEPVLAPLARRFGDALDAALAPTRPGHARLDLARLALCELENGGVPATLRGVLPHACTRCDAERYHSYRRDGAAAGRLVHWVRSAGPAADSADPRG